MSRSPRFPRSVLPVGSPELHVHVHVHGHAHVPLVLPRSVPVSKEARRSDDSDFRLSGGWRPNLMWILTSVADLYLQPSLNLNL